MEEKWKDIQGYEGLYQVSNLGRVRSIKILNCSIDSCGYEQLRLYKNGEAKSKKVHRLVAETFISNTDRLPQVNHKDENKTNNCIKNLEWCSNEYNHNYGTRNKRAAETRQKSKRGFKPCCAFKDDVLVAVYDSVSDAARQTGSSRGNIQQCLNGKRQTACGFRWTFEPITQPLPTHQPQPEEH